MAFGVQFIDIDEQAGTSVARSWFIKDAHIRAVLEHMAAEHFGEPYMRATQDEALDAIREKINREGSAL